MNINKLNQLIAWLSIHAMAWGMVFNLIPRTAIAGSALIFFCLVAFFAGGAEMKGVKNG